MYMDKNLKPQSYYEERYDLMTITDCIDHLQYYDEENRKYADDPNRKKNKPVIISNLSEITLYFLKGDWYQKKNSTIQDWMRKDEELDRKVDAVEPSSDLLCPNCGTRLEFTDKHIHDTTPPYSVILWYECPSCSKRAAYFDNGERYTQKPRLCAKCGKPADSKMNRKGDVITTTDSCPSCGAITQDIWDMGKDRSDWERKQAEERRLLSEYRSKFCFSDDEGKKYVTDTEHLRQATRHFRDLEAKQADPVYQKAMALKKLTVAELEKLLTQSLEKEKYVKLAFDKPEIAKFVIVPFTVQDSDDKRQEQDSASILRKVLKRTLEETNWRLMTDGLIYRLGYLSGRLKGYEREEDLMQLVSRR